MNPGRQLFLRIDREVRGPCDLATIRRLTENEVVSRETDAAEAAEGPWVRLETFPEVAEFLPARRVLAFKPTQFEEINVPGASSPDKSSFAAKPPSSGPASPPMLPPVVVAPAEPNEIEKMVREVQAREAEFAPPPVARRRRISTRVKIVVVLAVVCNTALLAIPTAYGAWGDEWSMLVVKAWFLTLNGGLVILYTMLPRE